MIYDATEFSETSRLDASVCVIGAGPAGISLALRLAANDIDVILLESGGLQPEPATQALYEGTVADARLHSPTDRYRVRQLGGSSTVWGGRCMPFDPIDFESREYVPDSGWPFDIDALRPYYPTAAELCEAGAFEFDADHAGDLTIAPLINGFSSASFTSNTLERFSCPTNFGVRYKRALQDNPRIRVLLHANVTSMPLTSSGAHLTCVTAHTLNGRVITVRAADYVLATGGIEVARLLLANRDVQRAGIGNDSDLVGRYYMCHLAGTIGALSLAGGPAAASHGYSRDRQGVYCRRRLALSAQAQRRERIGNFIARLHHPRITDPAHHNAVLSLLYLAKPLIPYEYRKRLHGDDAAGLRSWLRHVANVARAPFDAVEFAWHMLRERRLAKRKFPSIIIKPKSGLFSIDFHAEQYPNRDSRISLGTDVDLLGMPKVHVDWRYRPGDVATVVRSLELLRADIAQSGAGTFTFDESTVEEEMTRYGAYGGHHLGTARLGASAQSSVVDPDCRVHTVSNLFVASAAVFPTSSQANPTLTIVAMGLRLADHLARRTLAAAVPRESAVAFPTPAPGKRRVLVLGATGLVGRALVRHLSESTWATPVAGSRSATARGFPSDVETVALDGTDSRALAVAMQDVDAVVNCVAGPADVIEKCASNVAFAGRSGPQAPQIILLSSLAVYGSTIGEVSEFSPVRDDFGPYGSAKIRAERTLDGYGRATILRPGIIYGPGSEVWTEEIAAMLLAGRLGNIEDAGDGICNLILVDDVVQAISGALRHEPQSHGTFNLSTRLPLSWNCYLRDFAAALGVNPVPRISRLRLAAEAVLLGPALRAAEILQNRSRLNIPPPPQAIRRWLLRTFRQKIHMRSDQAERALGLTLTPIADGLRASADWYRQLRPGGHGT